MRKARIILADDHALILKGLERLLTSEFEIVDVVQDGVALVSAALKLRPDAVVVDISMPKLNGIEAARQILENEPKTKVVMLTMHADVAYATAALASGVHGYVLKETAPENLLKAIREALHGNVFVCPQIAGKVFRAQHEQASRSEPSTTNLTSQQREIVRLFSLGLSAKQVAAELGLSPRTIEYHKYRIMDQLKVESTAELIRIAVSQGMV